MNSALADSTTNDPFEGINRSIYSLNKAIDISLYKPLAKAYTAVTPDRVETGIHNFFSNISDVSSLINNLLQLKAHSSVVTLSRLAFNTTFGLAGMIDVATPMGLRQQPEDFGQTLGFWGVPSGPYLMLPLLGPSNVRDAGGLFADKQADLWSKKVKPTRAKNLGTGLRLLDSRVELFATEALLSGDEYAFIRDAYLQRRAFLIQNGHIDLEFKEDDF